MEALQTNLQKVLSSEENSSPFAVIDFDNTCIVNDIAEATLAYLCRNELLKNSSLVPDTKGSYGERVFHRYYELLEKDMLSAYIYIAPKPLLDLPQVSWRQSYNTIGYEGEILSKTELFGITIAHGLAVREVVKNILTFLENKKVAIWIVSASPEVTVQAAMNYFKIPGKLIGLRNKMVSDVLQSEVEKPYSIAEGKVECVKTYIDPTQRPLLGIGDTMNDFPMIEYATIHAVIDRGNALTKEARARNWHVL